MTYPSDVIAERRLQLGAKAEREVIVRIMRPTPDQDDFRCNFEIVGLSENQAGYAMGVDSAQALYLALQAIGTRLYTSTQAKGGILNWMGRRNLGFPVPDNISDLVPDD